LVGKRVQASEKVFKGQFAYIDYSQEFRQLNNDCFSHGQVPVEYESLIIMIKFDACLCAVEQPYWNIKEYTPPITNPVDPAGGDCYPIPAKPCESGVKPRRTAQ